MSNISLYRILYYHLPHALRMTRTLGWLRLSVTYLQLLMLRWDQSTLEARRLAYMTPQVCYLEKYLQIRFGDNTIRVINAIDVEQYSYLISEDTDVIDDVITRVIDDGGEVVPDKNGTNTTLVEFATWLGFPDINHLYLDDGGTILYTTWEMDTARFVVQVSQTAYDAFSESIKSTINKYRLPGFVYIFQVI